MAQMDAFLDILNPEDTFTEFYIGPTNYGGYTSTQLAANYSGIFSIVNNTADVPTLKFTLNDAYYPVTGWVEQTNTSAEFGLESRNSFTGSVPNCPPWQKPKP
jgi:hypothetical protein